MGPRRGADTVNARARLGVLTVLALAAPMLLATAPAGAAPDVPPEQELAAVTVLPPGESGFFSAQGQARGKATGNPEDYGPHIDDQRELYWNFGYKSGAFSAAGTPEEPRPGVRIYRDEFGVPSIYADSGRDVWFGAGYAVAQDRLFLMDAVRRLGRGTFAELTGTSAIPADIQQRVLTYSDEEYAGFLAGLSQDAKDAIEGYADGINAWRAKVMANPSLLPAEYELLSTMPEPWTVLDILAGGVLITRFVAAEGGNEFRNVQALRDLEADLGREAGRAAFNDLVWQEDREAAVTIPPEEAEFPNTATAPEQRDGVFQAMADYAATLPLELATGPGTPPAQEAGTNLRAVDGVHPQVRASVRDAVRALVDFGRGLHGGSLAVAVGPERTATGGAMLVSGPQLGYSYPGLLVELEVHGGGYDARGVSVPGLPTVGIGYGKRVAWALTTGYSKTIDSFIETTRANPVQGGPPQYLHDGVWKDQTCRMETVRSRADAEGVPFGPPAMSQSVEVCRTVHGPVVATTRDGTLARSLQYAMFNRELETVEGILAWNRAQDLDDFAAGVAQVTWNENVMYADADGHIAYWHPGLYPRRSPAGDQRLPLPGTGEFDHQGTLPFQEMPSVVDPDQGFLANWNNKPALGWLDGEGTGPTSRPAGPGQRLTSLTDQLEAAQDLTFTGLQQLEQRAGVRDHRAREYLPLILGLGSLPDLTDRERAALELLETWDGSALGPGAGSDADGTTDGPAPTVFAAVVEALRDEVSADLPEPLVGRQIDSGSHVFDMSALDNLVVRVLDPGWSSLAVSRDYTGGRGASGLLRGALNQALDALAAEYQSPDFSGYRRDHPRSDVCSLTGGVIGPCLTEPYQDRGSWLHLVAFDAAPAAPVPVGRVAGDDRLATALAVSRSAFATATAAVLARADTFPDALASGPLASQVAGPVLLTPSDRLGDGILQELDRLGVTTVYLAGGEAALGPGVARALTDAGYTVERFDGEGRVKTAALIADQIVALGGPVTSAIVVRADAFPDALAAVNLGTSARAPILLTPTAALDETTEEALGRLLPEGASVSIAGGVEAVGAAVQDRLDERYDVARLAGPTRYDTAVALVDAARMTGADAADTLVASGVEFPDALSAGVAAHAVGGVLHLVDPLDLDASPALRDWLTANRRDIERVTVIGGDEAVTPEVSVQIAGVLADSR